MNTEAAGRTITSKIVTFQGLENIYSPRFSHKCSPTFAGYHRARAVECRMLKVKYLLNMF